jgi:hypothetical protein
VTREYHHLQALLAAGGEQLTSSYWFPDAAFDAGKVGLFSPLEIVETVEISLYLLGVSAYARAEEGFGARLCAEGRRRGRRSLVLCARSAHDGCPPEFGRSEHRWRCWGGPRTSRSRHPRSACPPSPREDDLPSEAARVLGGDKNFRSQMPVVPIEVTQSGNGRPGHGTRAIRLRTPLRDR